MPRVVPSQVVNFIDAGEFSKPLSPVEMARGLVNAAELSGLISLIDKIPDELLVLDEKSYILLICCTERIKASKAGWDLNRINEFGPHLDRRLFEAIQGVRAMLAKCPDQAPAPATSELTFITDADLRTNLRYDIGAIDRALSNGEWKAATVLAGSAIEALLLWSLQQRPPIDVTNAASLLTTRGEFRRQPSTNLEDHSWSLHHYTEVAAHLGIIKDPTPKEVRLARDFRNLIHPGKSQRLVQKCDRGTALSSVAALDHVVRDLT